VTINSAAPAGWHPDPADPTSGALRYWDGSQWTDQVQVTAIATPTYSSAYPPAGVDPQWGSQVPPVSHKTGRNKFSFIAMGVAAAYILLAVTTHFVILGIIPLAMAIRSMIRKEQLAPIALGVAVVALVVGIAGFAGHV
jgi:hypothetical protein